MTREEKKLLEEFGLLCFAGSHFALAGAPSQGVITKSAWRWLKPLLVELHGYREAGKQLFADIPPQDLKL